MEQDLATITVELLFDSGEEHRIRSRYAEVGGREAVWNERRDCRQQVVELIDEWWAIVAQ